MIVIWMMMRMLPGMWLRIMLIAALEAAARRSAPGHDQRGDHLGRDGQRRADAEHLQGDRVTVDDRFEKNLVFRSYALLPEPGQERPEALSSPSQNCTMLLTPSAVRVAPEIPSTDQSASRDVGSTLPRTTCSRRRRRGQRPPCRPSAPASGDSRSRRRARGLGVLVEGQPLTVLPSPDRARNPYIVDHRP
jgi:hypothetical protein